jgi:hypothetical protein
MRSLVNLIDASGGKMYVPRDRYSFRMSFCVVPVRDERSAPCSSATATYRASSQTEVALMVIEVFIWASGIPSNTPRISPRWQMGTPTLPTSPLAIVASES